MLLSHVHGTNWDPSDISLQTHHFSLPNRNPLVQHKAFSAEVAWAASYFFIASKYFWERLEQSVPESGIRYKLIACNYSRASSIFLGFYTYCYCNDVQFANTIIVNYPIDNFSLPIVCDHLARFLVVFETRGFFSNDEDISRADNWLLFSQWLFCYSEVGNW